MSDHSKQYVLCVSRRGMEQRGVSLTDVDFGIECEFDELVDEVYFYRRDLAEQDENYLQLIPYVVLLRVGHNHVTEWFNYWRRPDAAESRLAGMRSVGLGGHVDITDALSHYPTDTDRINLSAVRKYAREQSEPTTWPDKLIRFAALRELQEEVGLLGVDLFRITPFYVGTNPVGRVHLGVLFSCMLAAGQQANPGSELHSWDWTPAPDLSRHADDMEAWSKEVITRFSPGIPALCR